MEEQEKREQHEHGGMDHGMGMMLGCLVPMAAILLLPRIGVSLTVSIVIGIVGMIALHAGMPVVQRLKKRLAANRAGTRAAEHHH